MKRDSSSEKLPMTPGEIFFRHYIPDPNQVEYSPPLTGPSEGVLGAMMAARQYDNFLRQSDLREQLLNRRFRG